MEKTSKKWSLGVLFKKNKKEIPSVDYSSDDEDRNAGFNPESIKKLPAGKFKSNRQLVENFDQQKYSIANPEFHYFKPQQHIYNNQNSFEFKNNQRNIERSKSGIVQPHQYIYNHHGSSQDEKSSYNSLSPLNRHDSENTSTGSKNSLNKKSRSARNERYFSRLQRDSYAEPDINYSEQTRPSTVYGSVSSVDNYPKYFTQPTHNYVPSNGLSASNKSSSLCSSDLVHPINHILPTIASMSTKSYEDKDYENIHASPPPIPKRDPNRRFSVNCGQNNNYYFDQNLQKYVIFNAGGRCFSDDKLWKNDYNQQQQNINGSVKQYNFNDSYQRSDILSPRSRKPLHITTNLSQSGYNNHDVPDYSRSKINGNNNQRSQSDLDFPSTINEKSNSLKKQIPPAVLSIAPKKQEIFSAELQALRKKYSSADDINQNNRLSCPVNVSTKPLILAAMNKSAPLQAPKKPARKIDLASSNNLDEAITELEKMYASLMNDHNLIERAEKRENPRDNFSELVKSYDDYENEEESYNDCEPDIVLDDLFSRNLQHSNKQIKVVDTQKPFGIPIGPIPPTPSNDYLSAEPIQMKKSGFAVKHNPDVIADDFAVRNLRKDFYGRRKGNTITMDNNHHMKRNHTLSSISDNIYSEILKNAARPSGGTDFTDDYLNLEKLVTPEERRSCSRELRSTLYHVNKNQLEPVETTSRKDFEQTLDDLVVESKAISQKLEKDLTKLKRESLSVTPTRRTMVDILDYRKSNLKEKPKVTTKSTACSPIQDLIDPPKIDVKEEKQELKPKVEKTEKIGNLIQMFNNNDRQVSSRRRNVSDITGMLKPTEICLKQQKEVVCPKQHIEIALIKLTEIPPRNQQTEVAKEQDVESNINNIKDLIQQIKQTDFQNQAQTITQLEDLPDYDNIQDYEMTNGKLERKPNQHSPRVDEYLSDIPKSTPSSSTTRATSLDSGSKSSTHECKSPADIYESALEFLNESATSIPENPLILQLKEKSPIEYLREDTEQVLNFIEQINDNLETAKCIEKVAPAPQISRTSPLTPKMDQVSETESNEYNSTEELSMIFGISDPPAGNLNEEINNVDEEFEMLVDFNNNESTCKQDLENFDELLSTEDLSRHVHDSQSDACMQSTSACVSNPILNAFTDTNRTRRDDFNNGKKETSQGILGDSTMLKTQCLLLACSYCISNHDFITIFSIVIAILTLICVLVC